MKRFTLLFMLICTAGISFGQVLRTPTPALVKQETTNDPNYTVKSTKAGGDVIWSTTFNWKDPSNPQGWQLPAGWDLADVSDLGHPWMWADDTLRWGTSGKLYAPSWFPTRSDGYLVLPMQYYNDREGVSDDDVPGNSYIQTPKIDCSAYSSVVVKFTQYWNLCCSGDNVGNLEMLVTTDEGVHFATYDLQYKIAANNGTPSRYRNVEINITDVAAGSPNVQVRFYWHGGNNYYFWFLDDLKLVEGYENDLVLEDYWLDFDGGAGETIGQINYWPLSQMGIAGEVSTIGGNYFKGALLNSGNADSENAKLQVKVLKNGTEIFSDASAANTIWTLERDTAEVTNPYIASDYGDYRFDYTAVCDNNEEVPGNNTTSLYFTATDTLFHRADFSAESSSNTGGWVGGDNAGDMVAVEYPIYAPCEINSMTAYISSYDATRSPSFQYVLLKTIDDVREEWMVSDVMDCDSTTKGCYVTLPVAKDGETEFLEPGTYTAAVRMWATDASDTNGANGMSVGYDVTTKPSGTLMYQSVGGTWYGTGKLNMIGIDINATGGPRTAPVTWNINMTKHIASGEFKPGTDVVAVNGLADTWTGTLTLTDPDGDGIYSGTAEGLNINTVLKYKYSINGNLEAYPTTGNPYRQYTVRYWNTINSGYYNGGVVAGVDPSSLVASFNVYPNPTNGAFTVEINNSVATDLIISLTNIQGQVVYQNNVKNVINYQQTIDNQLSRGMYFLTVNNGKEVKVQKVIVQ